MVTTVSLLGVTQLPPFQASSATVQITFSVLGIRPDLVQVYANGAGDDFGQLVDSIDIGNDLTYVSQVTVQAATEYIFHLCPRTTTEGVLDDEMDEKSWETFSTAGFQFTTSASQAPAGGDVDNPPPPQITSIQPTPATLTSDSSIAVTWSDGISDKYHFMFAVGSDAFQEFETTDHTFVISKTKPGVLYSLKVQGCVSHWLTVDRCSDFSVPTNYYIPRSNGSLRAFLSLSKIDQSHPVSIRGLNTSHAPGLRAFMKM